MKSLTKIGLRYKFLCMFCVNVMNLLHCASYSEFPNENPHKPVPLPTKYPYLWQGYGFFTGKGTGFSFHTPGLPVMNTVG